MHAARCNRVRGAVRYIRAWPVWALPRWLVVFVGVVIGAEVAATASAGWLAPARVHDLVLFLILLACDVATVELTRRAGENAGFTKDVYGVWELPVAILLPPVYALVLPVIRVGLMQFRIRRVPVYRRVFTASAVGLAFGASSVAFHAMAGAGLGSTPVLGSHALTWIMAVAACSLIEWIVNQGLVLTAVKGSDPTIRLRDVQFGAEPLYNDMTELCVAVVVTLGVAISPIVPVFAFPFVTLLQRSLRHSQLINASRLDSKTGLLNAGTWEREAATQVARAARTRTPLAMALLDIDHFKQVNDTHGHLAGDQVLKEIAAALRNYSREYDLAGRFGGEEFVLLLPHTTEQNALGIAERLRSHIAGMPVCSGTGTGAQIVQVTVSIGVAVLDETRRDLTDLLASADTALYRAKRDGRDQVRMDPGREPDRSPAL
jgi:diguanylate cyclase (GGDEF)-like protein